MADLLGNSMATIDDEITTARYDLMDEDKTQYTDPIMFSYYNRAVRALSSFLASVHSDQVFEDITLTLSEDDNEVTLPTTFGTPIKVEINDDPLPRREPSIIKSWQQETSPGVPSYYGIHKLNLILDRDASADTSIYIQFNELAVTLVTGNDMPYADSFNDSLRSAVVMIAKNRNDRDITGDYALQQFFRDAELNSVVRRSWKTTKNLGY